MHCLFVCVAEWNQGSGKEISSLQKCTSVFWHFAMTVLLVFLNEWKVMFLTLFPKFLKLTRNIDLHVFGCSSLYHREARCQNSKSLFLNTQWEQSPVRILYLWPLHENIAEHIDTKMRRGILDCADVLVYKTCHSTYAAFQPTLLLPNCCWLLMCTAN